jgi:hypothetical protein
MPKTRKTANNAVHSGHYAPIPSVAPPSTSQSTSDSATAGNSLVPTSTLPMDSATTSSQREPTSNVRRSTRTRITATHGTVALAPLSSSSLLSKGKAKEDRKHKPKYLPLGPPHLEALYSAAVDDLRVATCKAFYTICPREYLIRSRDSAAVRKRKKAMQPGVEDIKKAGFADVDKARRRVEEVNKLLDDAIEARRLEKGGDGGWTEDEEEIDVQVVADTNAKEEDEDFPRDFVLEMAKWKRLPFEEGSSAATSRGIRGSIPSAYGGSPITTQVANKGGSRKRKASDIEDSAASSNLQDMDQNSPPGKRYNTRKRKPAA